MKNTLYIYIWSRVPCSHTPPKWDGGGMMPLWWCIYIHTYLHTYLPTYLPTYLRTYIHTYTDTHTYIHTYIHIQTHTHTYIHTNIPTYHHHRPQGGGTRRTIPPPQATGGGTRRTIPPPQATGGGPEEPDDTVHPYPLVGGGGGWPTLHHIYIYDFTYGLFTNFTDDFPHQTSRERFQELATFDSGG